MVQVKKHKDSIMLDFHNGSLKEKLRVAFCTLMGLKFKICYYEESNFNEKGFMRLCKKTRVERRGHIKMLEKIEARAILFWIKDSLMMYHYGGSYSKPLIKAIEKIENMAGQKLYLSLSDRIDVSFKTKKEIFEEIVIESKKNPVPIRYKKIETIWKKYWEIEDLKKKRLKYNDL